MNLVKSIILSVVLITVSNSIATTVYAVPQAEMGPLHTIVWEAATYYGVSPYFMFCIVDHESEWDPWALSWTNDKGLFQFHVWPDGSSLMDQTPYAGASPYNIRASSYAAAWLIRHGQARSWMTYRYCN